MKPRRRELRARLLAEQGGRCLYCVRVPKLATLDHVIPRSRGGRDDAENLVAACDECNQIRGAMSVRRFLALRFGSPLMRLRALMGAS